MISVIGLPNRFSAALATSPAGLCFYTTNDQQPRQEALTPQNHATYLEQCFLCLVAEDKKKFKTRHL
ncbi:hypothetical protein HZ326_7294 [Fusarium oxysporum f. sp. albedinis]|nr:hypothetical protein HZ326_7294 [Fusarium oxysporum f. sp. albedinis]